MNIYIPRRLYINHVRYFDVIYLQLQESPISRDECWLEVTDKRTVAGNVGERDSFSPLFAGSWLGTTVLGIIYMEDVYAHPGARPPTYVSFIDGVSCANDFAFLPDFERALSRNNIDLRSVEISSIILTSK